MMRATVKDHDGKYVTLYRDRKNVTDWVKSCYFNEKILQWNREISRKEYDTALKLGYDILVKDTWTDEDVIVRRIFKDRPMNVVVKNGWETDEYLPDEDLRNDTRYFLHGYVSDDGFYAPF